MYILSETKSRREYKTKWQALNRAQAAGLNVKLLDQFYAEMMRRGYGREVTLAAVFDAARQGVFGFITPWERN